MNKLLTTSNRRMYGLLIPILAIMAMVLGISIPYEPALVIMIVCGIALFLMAIVYPEQMSYVICATSVISFQYIFSFEMMGMDLQSIYKIGILILLIPAMIHFGIYRQHTPILFALFGLLLITYLFSDLHPLLNMAAPLKAFIGIATPFVLLIIRWRPVVANRHIIMICLMPLISIGFGALFHVFGLFELFVTEFNGALRLQGANIPAHLAFLAFIAFMVSIIEVRRQPNRMTFFYIMTGANFLILLLTGTRGPLVAAVLMVMVFVYDLTRQFIGGKVNRIIPLIFFVLVVIGSVFWQLDNLLKRSFYRDTGDGIDTSGRIEAWTFFLKGVEHSPWFGRGLGSVLVSNDGSIDYGFVVPHNEYIRFYYDGGIVGAALLFLALLYVFRSVFINLVPMIRMYYIAFIIGFLLYSITDNTLSTLQFTIPFCMYLNALRTLSDHPMPNQFNHNINIVKRSEPGAKYGG